MRTTTTGKHMVYQFHVQRANLQAFEWINCLSDVDPLTPGENGSGWVLKGKLLHPYLGDKMDAPKQLKLLATCGCKNCDKKSCTCRRESFPCTGYY